MKKLIASLSLLTFLATPAVSADSVYGVWLRDGHDESLEFFDCEGKLCARETIGGGDAQMILRHAQPNGANQWKGELFNPENGKSYSGKIIFSPPNKLTLTGCLIAFLCQSESWTRAPKGTSGSKGGK